MQAADGWRDTLLGDEMPVLAVVQGILELHTVGAAEGLAAAHAHLKLYEAGCRHMKVPGLSIARFSCRRRQQVVNRVME